MVTTSPGPTRKRRKRAQKVTTGRLARVRGYQGTYCPIPSIDCIIVPAACNETPTTVYSRDIGSIHDTTHAASFF